MSIETALRAINNAVLDLQSADYNTYQRPLQRLATALDHSDLRDVVSRLKENVDLDSFFADADKGGGMIGSARLNWPTETTKELGLVIHLIVRGAQDPNWFLNIAHTYYYSGRKIVGDIRAITTAVIVPFNRDFSVYIQEFKSSLPQLTGNLSSNIEQDKEELLRALFRLAEGSGKRPSVVEAHLKLLPDWSKERLNNTINALIEAGDVLNATGAMVSVDISSGARKRMEQNETKAFGGVVYNIGSISNSPLQHVSAGGKGYQVTSYSNEDLQSIVALYRTHIDELDLDDKARRRADAQVATIEAQLLDDPDPTIVAAAGRSLKAIVESAIGGAIGSGLSSPQVWAPLLAFFS